MPPRITKTTPMTRVAARPVGGNVVSRIVPYRGSEDEYIKMLIYGRSKTGKSTVISTFPGKILWIVCSGSNKAGELKSIAKVDRKKVDMVTLERVVEMRDLSQLLRKGGYVTGVLDHVTGLQDRALAEVMKVEQLPAQMTWGTATREQWMEAGTNCRELLREFLGSPCNIVIAGQERAPKEMTDGDNELLTPCIGVDLMPSLAGWLYPTVDYIVQTFKKQKMATKEVSIAGKKSKQSYKVAGADYCLRTGPHEVYLTGFRLPRGAPLPDTVVDPDYDVLKQIIDGEWVEAEE